MGRRKEEGDKEHGGGVSKNKEGQRRGVVAFRYAECL